MREETKVLPFNRYHFVYLFDCMNGNPNGDPDRGNRPRQDPITQLGLMSNVSIKRKIRNYIDLSGKGEGNDIFVKERSILSDAQKAAYEAVGAKPGGGENRAAQQEMIRRYWDIRLFGAMLTTGKARQEEAQAEKAKKTKNAPGYNCGTLRQCVNVPYAFSIDPISPWNETITASALRNLDDVDDGKAMLRAYNEGDHSIDLTKAPTGNMGKFWRITYGLYRLDGSICPHMGWRNGATLDDIQLFWEALQNMWDLTASASRGSMTARRLIVFEHPSEFNAEPTASIYDRVQVTKQCDGHPSSYKDYKVEFDRSGLDDKSIKVVEYL